MNTIIVFVFRVDEIPKINILCLHAISPCRLYRSCRNTWSIVHADLHPQCMVFDILGNMQHQSLTQAFSVTLSIPSAHTPSHQAFLSTHGVEPCLYILHPDIVACLRCLQRHICQNKSSCISSKRSAGMAVSPGTLSGLLVKHINRFGIQKKHILCKKFLLYIYIITR